MAKEQSPQFPFYCKDFWEDKNVQEMTYEQVGVYLKFICSCWTDGTIPAQPERLAKRLKMSERTFRSIWPDIERCFVLNMDGEYEHPRIEKLRASRSKFLAESVEAGKRSAELRAQRKANRPSTDPQPTLEPKLNQHANQNPTYQLPVTSYPTPTPSGGGGGLMKPNPEQALPDRVADWFAGWIGRYPNATKVDFAFQTFLSLWSLGKITEPDLPKIDDGLNRYIESDLWSRENGRFIPAPANFLNGEKGPMWKDNPKPSEAAIAARRGAKRSSDGRDPYAEWVDPNENAA